MAKKHMRRIRRDVADRFRTEGRVLTRIEFMTQRHGAAIGSQVNLFAAPLLTFDWPEALMWRADILAAIATRRAKARGAARRIGGWRSNADLAGWEDPGIQPLVRWAAAMASRATTNWRQQANARPPAEWRMEAWANIDPAGGAPPASRHHVSRDWNWSALYVAELPEMAGGGVVFEDRDIGLDTGRAAEDNPRAYRHAPVEGELLIFPSWLQHRIEPHDGPGNRAWIAMNFHSRWLDRSRFWTYRKGPLWRAVPWIVRPLAKLSGKWDQSDPGGPPGRDVKPDPTYL